MAQNSAVLRRLASAYEQSGEYKKAAENFVKASEADPQDLMSYLGAKRTLERLGEYDQLEKHILLLQRQRRDLRYSVDLAEIPYLKGDKKTAIEKLDRLIEENSSTEAVFTYVGQTYIKHAEFEKAAETYKTGRKKLKRPDLFTFNLVNVYKNQKKWKEFSKEYFSYLEKNPKQYPFVETQFIEAAKEKDAADELVKLLKRKSKKSKNNDLSQLLATLYSRAQNYGEAIKIHEKLLSTNSSNDNDDGRTLINIAKAAERDGFLDDSEKAYALFFEYYQSSRLTHQAYLGKAALLKSRGHYHGAIKSFRGYATQKVTNQERFDAYLAIGNVWLEQLSNVDSAMVAFQQALRYVPNVNKRNELFFKMADCHVQQNNFDKAYELVFQVYQNRQQQKDELYKKAVFDLANLAFYQNQFSDAKEQLDIFFENPSDTPDIYENDAIDMIFLLQNGESDSTSLAVYAQSLLLKDQNQLDSSLTVLSEIDLSKTNPIKDEILFLKAQIFELKNNFVKAVEQLELIIKNPTSIYQDKALWIKSQLAKKQNDHDLTMESLERLLESFPSSIYIERAREQIRTLENS